MRKNFRTLEAIKVFESMRDMNRSYIPSMFWYIASGDTPAGNILKFWIFYLFFLIILIVPLIFAIGLPGDIIAALISPQ